MNYQWMSQAAACPIVEFHDVRTEKFRSARYLARYETALAGPLIAAGVVDLGQFTAQGHPERVVQVRGFASMLARRRALTAFHAGEDWAAHRAEAADLVREHSVMLMRAIRPESGIRPIRAGDPVVALISELKFPEQIGNYHLWLRLLLRKAGRDPVAAFATLEAVNVNDVPAVPVVRHRSQHIALLAGGGGIPDLPAELRGCCVSGPKR
ncbi:MAG: hypothetical protein ABI398_12040 [Devosia sp.]